jgi:hypothetical protein
MVGNQMWTCGRSEASVRAGTSPSMSEAFAQSWRGYRRRWFIVLALFLGYLPAVAGAHYLFDRVLQRPSLALVFGVAWLLCILTAFVWLWSLPCPRCARRFVSKSWLRWSLYAKACQHCGLPTLARGDECTVRGLSVP